ncbi:MAG: family 20 glycosylhydrolase [bacterium]
MLVLTMPLFAVAQNLMPVPAVTEVGIGFTQIDSSFSISIHGKKNQRVEAAALRFLRRLSLQTGIPLRYAVGNYNTNASLELQYKTEPGMFPRLQEDESYSLRVDQTGTRLDAQSFAGTLYGLETFLQLVEVGPEGFRIPQVKIEDRPRFPWRGLLIDGSRHWMPVDVIKRNLDGMAMVKMNVLHWHLSDDQGFRVESLKYPKLQQLGSDGKYYTQQQIREVITYAADRAIRVVPEFDMPGHSISWFVGHPEIASGPGPYQIARTWGIFDPSMDPTNEMTYKLLDGFIGEMASLFPDQYFHIGGDEVNGKQWDANPRIQDFKLKNNLKDNHALQAYFNRRVLAIVTKHGKKMIGWDEIFHPDLPKDIVVQSWRGQKSLANGASQGYQGILSFGYYLDLIRPASYHYSIDPVDSTMKFLSADQQQRILGGEACMWAEYVSPEDVDSRIWPRNAAIAERLWSPATTNDVDDMYRRLESTSKRLEFLGLTHRTSYRQMLERIAGVNSIEPLKVLADVVEPVKGYERGRTRPYTSQTPLNRLVDAVRPESDIARQFTHLVDDLLAHRISDENKGILMGFLKSWSENDVKLQPTIAGNELLSGVGPLSQDLSDVAAIGLRLVDRFNANTKLSDDDAMNIVTVLEKAGKQKAALLLMIVPSITKLYTAVQR